MNTAIGYGFFLTVCLCVAIVVTTGEVQRTIIVLAVCSFAALILTGLVEPRSAGPGPTT